MNEIERHLVFLIEESKNAAPAQVVETLKALDAIAAERAAELPPRLLHFLQGRSYQKALAFIRGASPQEGRCSTH